jgi:hypothetical protein
MARDGAQVSSPGLHRRESAKVREKAGDSPSAKGRKAKAAVVGRRPKRATTRPMRECWLTGKRGRKYFQEHHVMLKENDPDLTVWLSRGAHYLVNLLSHYNLIKDPEKLEDLIMLARTQAGLENKRIVVKFEEVK